MDIFLDTCQETAASDMDPDVSESDTIRAGANICRGHIHLHHIPQWRSHTASTPISWEDPRVIIAQIVTAKVGQRARDRLEFGAGATGVWRRGGSMGNGHDWKGVDSAIFDVKTQRLESAERSTVDWKSELELGLEVETAGDGVYQMLQ